MSIFFCSFVCSLLHLILILNLFSIAKRLGERRIYTYIYDNNDTTTMSNDSGSYHYKICCCLHISLSLLYHSFHRMFTYFVLLLSLDRKQKPSLRTPPQTPHRAFCLRFFFLSFFYIHDDVLYPVTSRIKITRKNYVRIVFSVCRTHKYIIMIVGIFTLFTNCFIIIQIDDIHMYISKSVVSEHSTSQKLRFILKRLFLCTKLPFARVHKKASE